MVESSRYYSALKVEELVVYTVYQSETVSASGGYDVDEALYLVYNGINQRSVYSNIIFDDLLADYGRANECCRCHGQNYRYVFYGYMSCS